MSAPDQTEDDLIRDLAYAVYSAAADDSGAPADPEARKAQWQADRATYFAAARRILRRLEAKGYSVAKTG